jgi:hypothetical protein
MTHGATARAREASKHLRHSGLAPCDGDGHVHWSPQGLAWLEDIAAYLQTHDPLEIGAAAILEASGYTRAQLTLFAGPRHGADSREPEMREAKGRDGSVPVAASDPHSPLGPSRRQHRV